MAGDSSELLTSLIEKAKEEFAQDCTLYAISHVRHVDAFRACGFSELKTWKLYVKMVYEEPTCADNLYYGEVNVNGSATESKTRLTHTVLPLIQWQYGNNTYQIIPSAYKYYVCNINDPNNILEGIEGSEGSSTLSGWRERINVIRRW